MKDLISIVMSTYNTQKEYLDLSIESILNQTYKNFEFIIICDGSQEEYDYIKQKYKDKRIKLILHKKNLGLPTSLNEGIKIAKGKYIARMDSDDISVENRLEIQKKYMKENPKVEICGMYAKCIGQSNKNCKFYFIKPSEIEIQVLYIPLLIHPTVMFKKSLFERNVFYNENFKCSQDYELWARTVNKENTTIIPTIGLYYRIHKKQAGQAKHKLQIEYTNEIHKENAKKINGILEEENIILCLKVLYGLEKLNSKNYIKIAEIIDEMVSNNINYNKVEFKKIIYNRYFILIVKNKLISKTFKRKVFNKVYNLTNLKYFIWFIKNVL